MALRAFLIALKLPQYEEILLGSGFDDVALFATFDNDDVKIMDKTLLTAGIPPGHVTRIMYSVCACQDKELRHNKNSSPLKFNYGKQMPLLKSLRAEVCSLKEQLRAVSRTASEQELIFLEEHDKWKLSSMQEQAALRAKSEVLAAVKKQLGAESKKRQAAEQAAAALQQAAKAAQEAARRDMTLAREAAKAEAQCEWRESETCKLLVHAHASIAGFAAVERDMAEAEARAAAAEARAAAAEVRADAAEARADAAEDVAAEEVVPPVCPHCGKRGPSPPPRVYSDLVTESVEPSSVC